MEIDKTLSAEEAYLDDCFTYHAPTPEQVLALTRVTEAFRRAAAVVLADVPASADRAVALRGIREARMWANAAIVLAGRR